MMVGKQWVKSWGMYRWASEANTQVKEASSNSGYEAESMHLTQHFITKTSGKGKKQCWYIQIVKKYKFIYGS